MHRRLVIWLVVLVSAATGAGAASVSGRIYFDADSSAQSIYEQSFEAPDEGVPDIRLYLIDGAGHRQTRTVDTGDFRFDGLAAGIYFLHPDVLPDHVCTSHSRGPRAAHAIADGSVKIVAFGDSDGVVGSEHPYPDRLGDLFAALADVTLSNIHVSGSTARQWVPGTDYWNNRLLPEVADADVVTFTLGGNDLRAHFGDPPYDPIDLIRDVVTFPAAFEQIKADILEIVGAIHEVRPEADVVYVVYPNFASSGIWQRATGTPWPVVRTAMEQMFTSMRAEIGRDAYVVLGDMLGSVPADLMLDPWLHDIIHPNDAGHQWFAEEIFRALGGAILTDETADDARLIGFDTPFLAPDEPLFPDDSDDDDAADDDTDDDDTDDDDNDDATGDDDSPAEESDDGGGSGDEGCG